MTSPLAQDTWHSVAHQAGSWIALGCLIVTVGLLLTEEVTAIRLAGLVVTTATIPLLVAGRFETTQSVASALRWSFAIYTLAWVAVLAERERLRRFVAGATASARMLQNLARPTRDLAMLLGIAPVVALTTAAVAQVASGVTFQGPAAESFFGDMSASTLYAVPLALLVVGTLIVAMRDGSPSFALLGSLLLQYFVALAVLLPVLSQGTTWSTEVSVSLAQWTACGLAGYALVWLALAKWIDRGGSPAGTMLLQIQLLAATAAVGLLAAVAIGDIFTHPDGQGEAAQLVGGWPSYLATVLGALALSWHLRRDRNQLVMLAVIAPSLLVTLAAATSQALASPGGDKWIAYHVWTGGWLVVALAAVATTWWHRGASDSGKWITPLSRSASVIALSVFALLVRGCIDDPIAPWWTAGVGAGLFVFFTLQAIRQGKQIYAYSSAVVAVFSLVVFWCHVFAPTRGEKVVTGFVYANVIAASLAGLFWLMMEIWHQSQRDEPFDQRFPLAPVHTLLAVVGAAMMVLVGIGGSAISTAIGLAGRGALEITDPWGVAALSALGLLLVGLLWDRRVGLGLVALYMGGIVAVAMICNLLQFTSMNAPQNTNEWVATWTIVTGCLLGAAYIALTGHLWKWGANLAQWASRLQIPQPIAKLEHVSRWLPAFNVVGTLVISSLGFIIIFTDSSERAMRVAVAFAPVVLAYGASCLAQRQRQFAMQCLALFLVVLSAVFIGWADVGRTVGDSAPLAYISRLLIVLAGMTLLYNLVVTRWIGAQHSWHESVRRSSAILAVATVAALAGVLALEVALFRPGVGAPIATPEVIAISVMLFGFLMALLSMAVLPGRDPLDLSEKGRQGYVYAAQAMAGYCSPIFSWRNRSCSNLGSSCNIGPIS